MLYTLIKALLSGAFVAAASEAAKRNPVVGAVILSLPLVSLSLSFGSGETRVTRKPLPHCPNLNSGSCCRHFQRSWCFQRPAKRPYFLARLCDLLPSNLGPLLSGRVATLKVRRQPLTVRYSFRYGS